jgi:Fe2+ transport system protein FeoA
MRDNLGQVEMGQRCIFERLDLPRRESLRLMEMGLTPGAAVEVLRRAPLGDPILLRVRGYSLSIRKSEACHIEVQRA